MVGHFFARLRRELGGGGVDVEEVVRGVLRDLEFVKGLPEGVRGVVRGCYRGAVGWGLVGDAGLVGGAVVAAGVVRERVLGG